ncbi:MAG: hypothetical protein JO210_02460 [Acidobacteriaceae bacterium]|nr:hypothetical protein [Acidobacteriaceae bacterium]
MRGGAALTTFPNDELPKSVVYKIDANYCYYKQASLGSQFVTQTTTNGTGVSAANGILKAYAAGAQNVCPLPVGGSKTNTFFSVDVGGLSERRLREGVKACSHMELVSKTC